MSEEKKDPNKESRDLKEHRTRMRFDWDNLIEDLIEEGRQQGAFDNLPGEGRPLNLKRSIFGGEWALANDLLEHNELKPVWITMRNELMDEVKTLRAEIGRIWRQHERAYRFAQESGQRGALTISWDDACKKWDAQIVKLNRRIDSFNLKRPSDNMEIFKLRLEDELKRVQAPRWLK